MLTNTNLQSAPLLMGSLTVLFTAGMTTAMTGSTWPIAWVLVDLAITGYRLRGIGRINAGRVAPDDLEFEHAIVLLGGLLWILVYGIGTALTLSSGLMPLAMLAAFNVAGTVSIVSTRNAATPRFGVLCMLLCYLPFGLAAAGMPQPGMGLLAVFSLALVIGLCAVTLQNNALLMRKFEAERKLIDIAHSDPLTGLANRKRLDRLLAQGPGQADDPDPYDTTLLCLDLDRFKAVNDEHGHAAGDHVLKIVAERISGEVRKGDETFRIGGDEFVCLLHKTDSRAAAAIADRIIRANARPIAIGAATSVLVGVSIGGATAGPGHDLATLLKDADGALYVAKRAGRNRYHQAAVSRAGSEAGGEEAEGRGEHAVQGA
ncbi:GGDEF domain-containing protein [Fulvimarina endophytica]|uniref:diguanylate cyclase n=1 Tax=Fulvimarina endophytica TaxID=2293836 RepID=A0A371X4K3_9HYPH|nr:GGDEF domain-containing protein [Fulvimarina endophytica]RFC64137.1 GGDEF domain-containing protein [Fulvimarina endophytica]